MREEDWFAWYSGSAWAFQPLPWWLRMYGSADWEGTHWARGWMAEAFPDLMPYYPFPSASPAWMDPWALEAYGGHWWM